MSKLIKNKLTLAEKLNDKPYVLNYFCNLESDCPLLKENKCIHLNIMDKCVYGRITKETGPSKRSKSYRDFIINKKKEIINNDISAFYDKTVVEIGDYYYVNLSFMNSCKNEIPFVEKSSLFFSGLNFIKKEDFNIETIKKIVKYVPKTLIGYREIKEYQEKSVPKFLFILKNKFESLYQEFLKEIPEIKEKEIKIPQEIEIEISKVKPFENIEAIICGKIKVISWDGTLIKGYKESDIWIKSKKDIYIEFEPENIEKIKIKDNKLINELILDYPELV